MTITLGREELMLEKVTVHPMEKDGLYMLLIICSKEEISHLDGEKCSWSATQPGYPIPV